MRKVINLMGIRLALSLSQVITNFLRNGDEMLNDSFILLNNSTNKMMVAVCIYVLPAKANVNKKEMLNLAHASPPSIITIANGTGVCYSNLLELLESVPENISIPRYFDA